VLASFNVWQTLVLDAVLIAYKKLQNFEKHFEVLNSEGIWLMDFIPI
jgi:hypothetical protein